MRTFLRPHGISKGGFLEKTKSGQMTRFKPTYIFSRYKGTNLCSPSFFERTPTSKDGP